ncbi:hypothetical protein DH2020_035181 [Rehmannia glutinosa]|uniref:Protein kinase domain-containing protein n=1 Tax=Rehmannia glutinosa TaxID=99300 RepID=A0ABR0V933_REHGL
MASSNEISSSRSTTPLMRGRIVIAYDATKIRNIHDFKDIITDVRMRQDMIRDADTILVLGVLDKVLHPMGFHIQIGQKSFIGSHVRAIEEEVSRKVDANVGVLQRSAEECEAKGVDIKVKIAVGAPIKEVVVQEIVALNTTWAILDRIADCYYDRQLRKELRFYLKHIPCKVAHVRDNLSLAVLRPYYIDKSTDSMKHKLLYSLSKPVSPPAAQDSETDNHSVISVSINSPQTSAIPKSSLMLSNTSHDIFLPDEIGSNCQQEISVIKTLQINSNTPVLCTDDEIKMGLDSLGCSYSIIQTATNNFSSDNLLGEGGYGVVYKGVLKDGQLIAVKVQKEANVQDFAEFRSDVYALSFARHTNVVTLLGYCCKENLKILIYEYICNKSLEWHLFDNKEQVLEWHRRHAIAIGIAKGLRFLHEECRGNPIVHRDIRPSNIFLRHDFVPLLGDYGLSKWKTNKHDKQTKILGSLAYLAPEFEENGSCSVKTDVYALGIVLLQLISGRKAVDSKRDNNQQSIRQWALPLIQTLALNELVDPRLGDSYNTYDLYNMARAAYICVQTEPAMRPTMGEVLCLLEGTNDHLRHVKSNLYPIILSTEISLS